MENVINTGEYEVIVGGIVEPLPRAKGITIASLGGSEYAIYGTYGDVIAYGVKHLGDTGDMCWFYERFVLGARSMPSIVKATSSTKATSKPSKAKKVAR